MGKVRILTFGLLITITSCQEKSNCIDKTFTGFWADTMWVYEFKKDGQFKFKSEGHYDMAEYYGTYTILEDLIFLNPDNDWQVFDGVLKTKLKIIGSDCIRDFNSNYYCATFSAVENWSEKEYDFQDKVKKILDSLPNSKADKYKVLDRNKDEDLSVEFVYDGIIVDKKKELHLFRLEKRNLNEPRFYKSYLVRKEPFEIFRTINKRDSLISVYNELNND